MINFSFFYQLIAKNHLCHWLETLPAQISLWQRNCAHSRQSKQWYNILQSIPKIAPDRLDLLNGITAQSKVPLNQNKLLHIKQSLHNFMPWRKGPFLLYDLYIDTEWRSDWKWKRVSIFLSNLKGRTVLDIGSGNGYYLWRMLGAGASLAVGIEPVELFLYQFEAVRKLLGNDQRAHLLPVSIEQLPALNAFDTVFSMGVLYHRYSPLEHLWQLKNQLVSGGELILETLVIHGNEDSVFMPSKRYAQMRNVYFIPSVLALKKWLVKCGFIEVYVADVTVTTIQEQRRTKWMTNNSLADFLDPKDISKTIEGYPAPTRAILIAKKP